MEARVAQDGAVLAESQVAALEKAKEEKKAHGEIETHHPSFLGAKDTYVKVARAKLCDGKNALIEADVLNDRVIPFYEQNDTRLLNHSNGRMLWNGWKTIGRPMCRPS